MVRRAQPGEARLAVVFQQTGITRFRLAMAARFDLLLEVRL